METPPSTPPSLESDANVVALPVVGDKLSLEEFVAQGGVIGLPRKSSSSAAVESGSDAALFLPRAPRTLMDGIRDSTDDNDCREKMLPLPQPPPLRDPNFCTPARPHRGTIEELATNTVTTPGLHLGRNYRYSDLTPIIRNCSSQDMYVDADASMKTKYTTPSHPPPPRMLPSRGVRTEPGSGGGATTTTTTLVQRRDHRMPLPRASTRTLSGTTTSSYSSTRPSLLPPPPSSMVGVGVEGRNRNNIPSFQALDQSSTLLGEENPDVDESGTTSFDNDDDDHNSPATTLHKNNSFLLAPMELKRGSRNHGNKKYASFQGVGEYQRVVMEGRGGASSLLSHLPTHETHVLGEKNMYRPQARGMHGVTEMSDMEELNAIFKKVPPGGSGTKRTTTIQTVPLLVVGEGSDGSIGGPNIVSPQSVEPPPSSRQSLLLSRAYPVDDRQVSNFSIPSIRLANHVESKDFYRENSYTEYTDTEEGMSVDTESYYSFLGGGIGVGEDDDDDSYASLSSRGSFDPDERRRRISRNFLRMTSSGDGKIGEDEEVNMSSNEEGAATTTTMINADVVRPFLTNSFEERMREISIQEGKVTTMDSGVMGSLVDEEAPSSPPPLPRRVRTFEHDNPPPPVLNIDVKLTCEDDAGLDHCYDYKQDTGGGEEDVVDHAGMVRTRQAQGRRQRRRRNRKEGAAVDWIQDLQSRSTHEVPLIAESASSKFLMGGDPSNLVLGGGIATAAAATFTGVMNDHALRTDVGTMTSEEIVAKALGMPHPLCRSSTIETGPFTLGIHQGGIYEQLGSDDVASGGNALTSLGSGD